MQQTQKLRTHDVGGLGTATMTSEAKEENTETLKTEQITITMMKVSDHQ